MLSSLIEVKPTPKLAQIDNHDNQGIHYRAILQNKHFVEFPTAISITKIYHFFKTNTPMLNSTYSLLVVIVLY